ncbi:MAG TPA: molybdenum cofactor biosynthesis protein MoaE [Syntrophaceae bacterium]|nr:molybdenum cofactor biosynthesis protein MoaE [Syntrophaceae bacterium]
MELWEMIEKIKSHPNFGQVGMILCHNGIVRGTSRDGHPVQGIDIMVDRSRLVLVLDEMKSHPGIVEILAEIKEGTLKVGEDIMWIVVAGDTRDNVFPVLEVTVERIKKEVVKKTEF